MAARSGGVEKWRSVIYGVNSVIAAAIMPINDGVISHVAAGKRAALRQQ